MKKLKTSIVFQIVMLTICGNLFSQEQKPKDTIVKNVPVIELNGMVITVVFNTVKY